MFHLDDNERENLIQDAKKNLNKSEKNYSALERKPSGLYSHRKVSLIIFYVKKFKFYTVYQVLKYLINLRDPHGRIAR